MKTLKIIQDIVFDDDNCSCSCDGFQNVAVSFSECTLFCQFLNHIHSNEKTKMVVMRCQKCFEYEKNYDEGRNFGREIAR